MMEFLYFPENKAEYIPAIISLVIFMVGAVIMTYILMKKSKKEEKEFNQSFMQEKYTEDTDQPHYHK